MSVKINRLEIENVKRVRAVRLEPSESGLTVIGGRNGQGKTSVLDAIAWALGGDRLKPSNPSREGSVLPPQIRITLSNGLIVERKGKNGELKVTDPTGRRAGQQLLNTFVEQLALNLPKFMEAGDKEKADTLLKIIGVGEQLAKLDMEEKALYSERTTIGRIADQKKKFAAEMPQYEGVPADLISPSELIRQQQDILARNGENARKRNRVETIRRETEYQQQERDRLRRQYEAAEEKLRQMQEELDFAVRDAMDLHDEATAELEASIAGIDEINRKVRANLDREKAHEDAMQYVEQYSTLTAKLDAVRDERRRLLDSARLPLPGLSVQDGRLLYKEQPWDGMSGADQLRVAAAIVRRLNPDCGFVLMDKLEQMDAETLDDFGQWLQQEGLQVIATRVSTGGECSIIIEDGEAIASQADVPTKTWTKGVF